MTTQAPPLPGAPDLSAQVIPRTTVDGVPARTDVHAPKKPLDSPDLQLERPPSRFFRAWVAWLVIGGVGATLFLAVLGFFKKTAPPPVDARPLEQELVARPLKNARPLPDIIADPPKDLPPPSSSTASQGPPQNGRPSHRGFQDQAPSPSPPESPSTFQGRPSAAQLAQEELQHARGADLFPSGVQLPDEGGPTARAATATPTPSAPAAALAAAQAPSGDQDRKSDFLSRNATSSSNYVSGTLQLPRSPYEIKAGSIIAASLLTGISSDLPGEIVAQVRSNVYDTVTGNFLLIPQGSRLLAKYDSNVVWGQERVLLCWQRLIRPDGSSLDLGCAPGVDQAGYSGFSDSVDNHWTRLIAGALLASVLAGTAQRTQGDVSGYQPSIGQQWAGNVAGSINQAGQQITQRNLQVQPTLTIRPGYSVNVLVNKDLVIPPYASGDTLATAHSID